VTLGDAREREASTTPDTVLGQRLERVRGTRRSKSARAAGKWREEQLVGAYNHERDANAGCE
jgi:hypothetical protein